VGKSPKHRRRCISCYALTAVGRVTAEIVHNEQDRALWIGAHEVLQKSEEIVGTHPLADQIDPLAGPHMRCLEQRPCDIRVTGGKAQLLAYPVPHSPRQREEWEA
jgi:hypothetical protein